MAFKIYSTVAKGLKPKPKVLRANSYVWRSYKGKTGRGSFLPTPNTSGIGLSKYLAKYQFFDANGAYFEKTLVWVALDFLLLM